MRLSSIESLTTLNLGFVKWELQTVNDNVVSLMKARGKDFRYNSNMALECFLHGEWWKFEYNGTIDGMIPLIFVK